MTEQERKQLAFIKKDIPEGSYQILQPQKWDEFSYDLANCGASLLQEIEDIRDRSYGLKINLFFFCIKRQLIIIESDYDKVAEEFNLFFDASMRWLKCIIEHNEYKEAQLLQRKYIENLSNHCSKILDRLNNSVSSKRSDYYHYQALFLSMVAIFVAALSFIISIVL
jgi:hypothetical protein